MHADVADILHSYSNNAVNLRMLRIVTHYSLIEKYYKMNVAIYGYYKYGYSYDKCTIIIYHGKDPIKLVSISKSNMYMIFTQNKLQQLYNIAVYRHDIYYKIYHNRFDAIILSKNYRYEYDDIAMIECDYINDEFKSIKYRSQILETMSHIYYNSLIKYIKN